MNDQERITELETRVAFQEDTLDKLNNMVASQEIELERLKRMLKIMNQQLKNLTVDGVAGSGDNEPPPPHY
ncbi:SlyX family protein [Neptuniibacter sp. QD72_48]|uniref:SlyX family protein n=1 Tax=unclassified Neptuniibacter TaxID=2630693 RepID=UPI0039F4B153